MKKLINTKLLRKFVRNIAGDNIYGKSYTDINKTNNELRDVTFFVYKHKAEAIATELRETLELLDYTNVVKVTTSKEIEQGCLRGGGNTYLRINNCVLA